MAIIRLLFTYVLLLMTFVSTAQTPIEFRLAGGIKRNVFETVKKDVTAFNITPGYDEKLVVPSIKNSQSFFIAIKSTKKLNNRISFTNTAGLDMQQLNIESGFKKQTFGAGITGFKQEYSSTLLPRIKLDFGFKYAIVKRTNGSFDFGLAAGQLIKLSSEGYGYSFVEGNISVSTKNITWFASGSLSPYNVSLPNFQGYLGNLNADVVGSFEYRVYDLCLGASITL